MPTNPPDAALEKIPYSYKVLLGTIAGMLATTLFHPLDLVKVRLQIYDKPGTSSQMALKVIKCDGYKALYRGLSASMLRQATYTPTRLAVYYFLYEQYVQTYDSLPTLDDKVIMGVLSGLVGGFACIPTEVALIRLMSDGPNGPCCVGSLGRKYRGVFDVFGKMVKREGVQSLWRGGVLTLMRSVFVSFVQIETYDQTRLWLKQRDVATGVELHFYTSVLSSFFTAFASLPVDTVKTLYQVRSDDMTQRDILSCLIRSRGLFHFWKGFFPYFTRLSSHTFITSYILEMLCNFYRYIRNKDII